MSTTPYDPPVAEPDSVGFLWVLVVGSWMLAGACVGTGVGATLQLMLGMAGAGARLGIGGMAVGALAGGLVLGWERARAVSRPELVDGSGGRSRPLHGAVLGLPALAAIPALLWLVVIGTVGLESPAPAVTFGMAAIGVGWAGQRVWSSHRLARALEGLEEGRLDAATRELEGVAGAFWLSARARATARLNLAMLALNAGDGDAALRWADGPRWPSALAWAGVIRAQAHLLRRDPVEVVEEALAQALTSPGACGVQAQADAVRVLAVWRREGEAGAREVAERLHGPGATALHGALLAALRERAGDAPGAAALRTDEVGALRASGLGRAIPELG